jgi:hypothetical protein
MLRPILHKVSHIINCPNVEIPSVKKSSPLCHTCKYFDNDGTCKLFFATNYITDRVEYIKASDARTANTLCGPDGKYYTEK